MTLRVAEPGAAARPCSQPPLRAERPMSVLIKAALIAVLLYLMLKSVANLVRAVLDDPTHRRAEQVGETSGSAAPPTSQSSQAFGDVEVEDAKWEDL